MEAVPEETELFLQFSSLKTQVIVLVLQLLKLLNALVEAGPKMHERIMYLIAPLEVSYEFFDAPFGMILMEFDGFEELGLAELIALVAFHSNDMDSK